MWGSTNEEVLAAESLTYVDRKRHRGASRMGKVPVRLKEVVYTLSPFEQSVMSGLWKDMPHKTAHYMSKVSLTLSHVVHDWHF